MNKTSKDLSYPNMTQDEPERVKEITARIEKWRGKTDEQLAWAGPTRTEMVQHVHDIIALLAALSVSEKRAETAEFKLADDQFWKLKAEQAESERDSSQASLLRVVEAAGLAEQWVSAFEISPSDGWVRGRERVLKRLRTALSPHTEK